jgi:hypothetical protein
MAQLNDLLVAGPSTLLGPTTVNGTLIVNGEAVINGEELSTAYLKVEDADDKYITASVSGTTLTIYIP